MPSRCVGRVSGLGRRGEAQIRTRFLEVMSAFNSLAAVGSLWG